MLDFLPMKRRRRSTIRLVSLALLASCSTKEPSDHAVSAKPDTGTEKRFKVALLTPGPISDQSWNGGAYQGLLRIRDSLGASVSHIQTKTPAEFEEQFRQYGAQGYDLVFGHGFEFQDAAKRVGPEFPRTIYVTTSSSTSGANVAGMEFAFADASFLAGLVAGSLSKTGILGVIGGTELPPVKESFVAFEKGARAANPSVRILKSYIGNWDDVSAGKEQTLEQVCRCRRSSRISTRYSTRPEPLTIPVLSTDFRWTARVRSITSRFRWMRPSRQSTEPWRRAPSCS